MARSSRLPRGVLVVTLALLAALAAAEIVYLVRDATPAPSTARPVVTGALTSRAAVEAAARSTEEILSTSYQDYDEQLDRALATMTDSFAAQYRRTAVRTRDGFVAHRTRLQVKAVAQGVVRASPRQVQALLFLDQTVRKVEEGAPATDYAQYRALVTVVHTDRGWLVSDIETK